MKAFYETRLEDSNEQLSSGEKFVQIVKTLPLSIGHEILSYMHIFRAKKK